MNLEQWTALELDPNLFHRRNQIDNIRVETVGHLHFVAVVLNQGSKYDAGQFYSRERAELVALTMRMV